MEENNQEITILTREDTVTTRSLDRLKKLSVDTVSGNMVQFVNQLDQIFQSIPQNVAEFQLDEVTVSAEITASGSFLLLGSGVEAAGSGAISFKFSRK